MFMSVQYRIMSRIANTAGLDNLMTWHNTAILLWELHITFALVLNWAFKNLTLHFSKSYIGDLLYSRLWVQCNIFIFPQRFDIKWQETVPSVRNCGRIYFNYYLCKLYTAFCFVAADKSAIRSSAILEKDWT